MTILRIASFNINSIRIRLPDLQNWMINYQPDIVCLQETKVQDKDFPVEPITAAGYHSAYFGEKGKNGVAILSKQEPDQVTVGLDEWGTVGEARLISARFASYAIVNTYVPQGREVDTDYFQYKLNWLTHLRDYFSRHFSPEDPLLWVGDFNVAPEAIDVHNPKRLAGHVGFHPAEQAALAATRDWGFTDVFRKHCPDPKQYTFWDYRVKDALQKGLGWRIDHIYATQPLASCSVAAAIDTTLRKAPRPSDHAPITATFELS